MAMCQHRAQIAHSAAGNEDGSFLANHSCCQLLELVDGRIVTPDIVAYLSLPKYSSIGICNVSMTP